MENANSNQKINFNHKTILNLIQLIYFIFFKKSGISIYLLFFISISISSKTLILYSSTEVLFHLIFIYRQNSIIQFHNSPYFILSSHSKLSSQTRRNTLLALISSFESKHQLRQCLLGWFYFINSDSSKPVTKLESIRIENMLELLSGIFYSSPLNKLNPNDTKLIHQDLQLIQDHIQFTFQPGKNLNLASMNHSSEPIRIEHRLFIFYLLIESFRFLIYLILLLFGFRQFQIHLPNHLSFKYWFHPGLLPHSKNLISHPTPTPIILIPGIVGLISIPHYAIYLLLTSKRPIFLVGNSSVSLTLFKSDFEFIRVKNKSDKSKMYLRRKILTLNEQSTCILKMIKIHGLEVKVNQNTKSRVYHQEGMMGGGGGGAFLIGHSLGTTLIGHFVRNYPDSVAGALSIDPISILPYIPHLVRCFIYSEPKTIGEYLVRIVSREIGVATVIHSHFNWLEFVIFTHLKPQTNEIKTNSKTLTNFNSNIQRTINHHFILSDQDALVNYEQVSNYLRYSSTQDTSSQISFTTLVDTPHAGFLLFHLHQVGQLTLKLINQSQQIHENVKPTHPIQTQQGTVTSNNNDPILSMLENSHLYVLFDSNLNPNKSSSCK